MNDVPKIVRQRMTKQPASGEHPDANLLAAFAEGGLTGREREQVLSHMGTCAVCRETAALAAPEISIPVTNAASLEARAIRWPVLRWAGVAAAVVVVAVAAVIQNSRRAAEVPKPSVATAAKSEAIAPPPVSSPGTNEVESRVEARATVRIVAPRRDARAKEEQSADKKKDGFSAANEKGADVGSIAASNAPQQLQAGNESSSVTLAPPAQPRSAPAAGTAAGGVIAMEQKQQQQAAAPTPQVPSAATESVEIAGQAASAEKQKSTARDQIGPEFDGLSGQGAASTLHGQATTDSAAAVTGGPFKPSAAAGAGTTMMKTAMIVAPQWRLSAEGALERSIDAGNTWHPVQVAAPAPTLRTFSASGREIWAGGSGGALYHSADGGRTWARVKVKAGGMVLNSDIVRVEFTDGQRGAVKSASGETWTTDDGGTTWSIGR
jgi:Photosynthesis system II assembly factor YCF48/Putative zinc-finger